MKQIMQNLGNGEILSIDVPVAPAKTGSLLIRTRSSLISAGTERMLVDFGRAGWIAKARQQPEKVSAVLDKTRTDGLVATVEAVRTKLEQPLPLGYCNAGVVEEVGPGVSGVAVGDRVVSNGPHAEIVSVPWNLCARILDPVADDEAAFAPVGAIALQGIRLAQPTLGECVVVTGLGLIGLITTQLLIANGCRVLGIDPDRRKAEIARTFGAKTVELAHNEDPVAAADAFSRGRGVDAVLLTLSSKGSESIRQAAQMCRKRGRIVLVGVSGMELTRADFYEKELSFQVSCSYGPGRYDPEYEQKGNDYPIGFVRWTAQRNFEAVLDMLATGALDVKPLITHRFRFEQAEGAYEALVDSHESALGIVLQYSSSPADDARTVHIREEVRAAEGQLSVGVIGAGNYAGRVLIPALRTAGVYLHSLANNGSANGAHIARKYGFAQATTDPCALIESEEINAIVVTTRHDSHAEYACAALAAGKHVFIEKPLALTAKELGQIESAYDAAGVTRSVKPLVMVGFNRRFCPLVIKMKELLGTIASPKYVVVTVNAGSVSAEHWIQNAAVGGGRIVGEACHFVDLARHLAGAPIMDYEARVMKGKDSDHVPTDTAALTLSFEDGSLATIHYFSNGHRRFPKERVEVFCSGRVLQLDNYRRLEGYGWPGFRKRTLWRQDKGQLACVRAFVNAARDGLSAPIGFAELVEVGQTSIALAEAARS